MDPVEFYKMVVKDRRYNLPPEGVLFIDRVVELLGEHARILEKESIWHRAQLGGVDLEDVFAVEGQKIPGIRAYYEERMIPDPSKCGDGRCNVKGQAVFYFTREVETAIKEKRPWRGAELSIARFRTKKPFKMATINPGCWLRSHYFREAMSSYEKLPRPEQDLKILEYIHRWFSTPLFGEESAGEYVPTQIISERLRVEGYDGILYESAADKGKAAGLLFCPPYVDPHEYFSSVLSFENCWMTQVESLEIKLNDYSDDPTVFDAQTARNKGL